MQTNFKHESLTINFNFFYAIKALTLGFSVSSMRAGVRRFKTIAIRDWKLLFFPPQYQLILYYSRFTVSKVTLCVENVPWTAGVFQGDSPSSRTTSLLCFTGYALDPSMDTSQLSSNAYIGAVDEAEKHKGNRSWANLCHLITLWLLLRPGNIVASVPPRTNSFWDGSEKDREEEKGERRRRFGDRWLFRPLG